MWLITWWYLYSDWYSFNQLEQLCKYLSLKCFIFFRSWLADLLYLPRSLKSSLELHRNLFHIFRVNFVQLGNLRKRVLMKFWKAGGAKNFRNLKLAVPPSSSCIVNTLLLWQFKVSMQFVSKCNHIVITLSTDTRRFSSIQYVSNWS